MNSTKREITITKVDHTRDLATGCRVAMIRYTDGWQEQTAITTDIAKKNAIKIPNRLPALRTVTFENETGKITNIARG